jgi:hypothetical protein
MFDIFTQLFGNISHTVGSQCPCGGHSNQSRNWSIFVIFTQLFGKILQLFSLSVLVVAIAASQEIGKSLTYFPSFWVKYYNCWLSVFHGGFSWMSEFNADLFAICFT